MPANKRLQLASGRFNRDAGRGHRRAPRRRAVETRTPAIFANGEIHCRYEDSIRGGDLFIIQTHCNSDAGSLNDAVMEQLIMVDAATRASAKRVTVVMPFYGYARQDRKASGREPITARLMANLFETAGAKRLLSIDLHSGQIQGFFNGPVDHLTAMPVLVRLPPPVRRRPRHRLARHRSGEGGRPLRQRSCTPAWPSSTSSDAKRRRTRWRRSPSWARSRAGPAC